LGEELGIGKPVVLVYAFAATASVQFLWEMHTHLLTARAPYFILAP